MSLDTLARFYLPDASTDGQGVATIELPREKISFVHAYARADKHVTTGANWGNYDKAEVHMPAEFTFTLEPGTTMGGTVRDEQGRPIAGVQVVISGGESLPGGIRFNSADDTVRTDAQGKWTDHRVPKDFGRYDCPAISLKHPDYASPPAYDLKSRPLDQLRGGTAVMVMHKGIVVEGVVTDPQGKTVAGAAVGQFEDLSGSEYPRATTDQKGHYRLPACDAGEYTIAAAAKGYAPDSQQVTVGNSPLTVGLQLRKGELIQIRVVDNKGKPLKGATVATVFDNENWCAMMLDYQTTYVREKDQHFFLTDAEGRWSKLWISDDKIHFMFSKPGYAQSDMKVAPGGPEHIVTLQFGGWSLSGRVVDRDTKAPITKFHVVVGNGVWRSQTAVENAKGEYVIQWDEMSDPRRVLRIEADGHSPSETLKLDSKQCAVTFNVEL